MGVEIWKKEDKQFPLPSKNNCVICLIRVISSYEICMYRLKNAMQREKDYLRNMQVRVSCRVKFVRLKLEKTVSQIVQNVQKSEQKAC